MLLNTLNAELGKTDDFVGQDLRLHDTGDSGQLARHHALKLAHTNNLLANTPVMPTNFDPLELTSFF